MKIKKGFVKKPIMDEIVVVPTGKDLKNFNGLIKLNDTGSFIWDEIDKGKNIEEITDDICSAYDVDKEEAYNDVEEIINQMAEAGILEKE